MIPVPGGVQVWLAIGHTDMRRGFDGLALLVQETLKRRPRLRNLSNSMIDQQAAIGPYRAAISLKRRRVSICSSNCSSKVAIRYIG